MTLAAFLRHAPTDWSAARRLQGRADRPLLPDAGAGWRLPPELAGWSAATSPLARARATAARLGLAARIEPALVEMDWGAWEGERLADLRARDPAGLAAAEAAGLDLRAPRGETPREVMARLAPFLETLATPTILVTHKGVIRAALALATGWDMRGRAPVRLADAAAHLFETRPRLRYARSLSLVSEP